MMKPKGWVKEIIVRLEKWVTRGRWSVRAIFRQYGA